MYYCIQINNAVYIIYVFANELQQNLYIHYIYTLYTVYPSSFPPGGISYTSIIHRALIIYTTPLTLCYNKIAVTEWKVGACGKVDRGGLFSIRKICRFPQQYAFLEPLNDIGRIRNNNSVITLKVIKMTMNTGLGQKAYMGVENNGYLGKKLIVNIFFINCVIPLFKT